MLIINQKTSRDLPRASKKDLLPAYPLWPRPPGGGGQGDQCAV